jgi:hypothetical protein
MSQSLPDLNRRRSETAIGDVCLATNGVRKNKKLGVARGAIVALSLVMLTGSSWAGTAPIYKCFDRNLGLLYTDLPCKDGEQLDIRPGEADLAAVARLERQLDALDQSASQRIAEQRRAATQEMGATRLRYEAVDQGGSYDQGPTYVSDYGIVSQSYMHHHPRRSREAKLRVRHFAPPPPYIVPRH